MRLVFAGTAAFAVPSLRALAAAGHSVELVVTQPDRPGDRLRVVSSPVKAVALELGLPLLQPERIRAPETVAALQALAPELMVVVAYGQIIPAAVLAIPSRGVLNVHGSLLPRHRGAAPVAHAILAGDSMTGVTIMAMDELLDHGPVLATAEVPIGPRAGAADLTASLAEAGANLLVRVVGRLDAFPAVAQDHSLATIAPRLRKADGRLEWTMSSAEIDRRVRALNPWPGTVARLGGRELKVLRGSPAQGAGIAGEIIARGRDGLTVATADGAFRLEEVQLPGRRPTAAGQLALSGG